jgi:hypothetical protein
MVVRLFQRFVGCWHHACQLPKLFIQIAMAVKITLSGNFYNLAIAVF